MNKIKIAYIFPNLITASSIFVGLLSIIYSSKGEFTNAVYMIILSGVLDNLDGKVARLTNTQSKFGLEFDSIADVISFGIAPAMLMYFSVSIDYGRLGILATCMFVIFGAIRLAKFNSISQQSNIFLGLPIPVAAIFLAIYDYFMLNYLSKDYFSILLIVSTVLSLLMVSNIRYPSFKTNLFAKQYLFRALTLILVLFALVYIYPLHTVLVCATLYTLWGPFKLLINLFNRKRINKTSNPK